MRECAADRSRRRPTTRAGVRASGWWSRPGGMPEARLLSRLPVTYARHRRFVNTARVLLLMQVAKFADSPVRQVATLAQPPLDREAIGIACLRPLSGDQEVEPAPGSTARLESTPLYESLPLALERPARIVIALVARDEAHREGEDGAGAGHCDAWGEVDELQYGARGVDQAMALSGSRDSRRDAVAGVDWLHRGEGRAPRGGRCVK